MKRSGLSSRRSKGSALLAALFICVLFLLMGLALLATRSRVYSESSDVLSGAQARENARAGLTDAWLKLSKDVDFPPPLANRKLFSWAEDIYAPDPDSDPPYHWYGNYVVTVDVSWRGLPPASPSMAPWEKVYSYPLDTVLITSWGYVYGPLDGRVVASHRIVAQVDLSPTARSQNVDTTLQPTDPNYYTNPNFNQLIRFEDSGSF